MTLTADLPIAEQLRRAAVYRGMVPVPTMAAVKAEITASQGTPTSDAQLAPVPAAAVVVPLAPITLTGTGWLVHGRKGQAGHPPRVHQVREHFTISGAIRAYCKTFLRNVEAYEGPLDEISCKDCRSRERSRQARVSV